MLEKLWRKVHPPTLFVRMKTGTATMESSMEVLQKTKNRVAIEHCNLLLGIYTEKMLIQEDTCTSMFITAIFAIAKTWKQPKCPLTDE